MALGRWFASTRPEDQPDVLLCSPYVRARQTAELFQSAGGAKPDEAICGDERLREKEFGILDGLTVSGIHHLQPEQAEFRRLLGKFYHRPPGGESWCDVILRLRSLMDTVSLHYAGRRVMIFAHQVVVLCLRTIIEHLDEPTILAIDRQGDVANCGVTEYRYVQAARGGELELVRYNVTAPVEAEGAPVTRKPDRAAGIWGDRQASALHVHGTITEALADLLYGSGLCASIMEDTVIVRRCASGQTTARPSVMS